MLAPQLQKTEAQPLARQLLNNAAIWLPHDLDAAMLALSLQQLLERYPWSSGRCGPCGERG